MTDLTLTVKFRCCITTEVIADSPLICGKEFASFYDFWQHHIETKHRRLQIMYRLKGIESELLDL